MKEKEFIWKRLSKYLNQDKKDFVLKIFSNCYDYSAYSAWDKVIAELVKLIYKRKQRHGKNIQVVQVKSKFGGLRFYIDGDQDDYLQGAIYMAEIQCSKICPYCGSVDEEREDTGRFVKRCVKCDEGSFEMT